MKRVYVLLLALLLLLAGCTGKNEIKNISVKDVSCPYEIKHQKDGVQITLRDGKKSGILWQVKAVPEEICQVTEETTDQEYVTRYRLTGAVEGAAQLTFMAQREDATVVFELAVIANVDGAGKTTVSATQHRETEASSVEADGLNYKWNVDLDGVLHFSFINDEDLWSASSDGAEGFTLTNMMGTSTGCKFSAQALKAGQVTVVLVGEATQRTIHVVVGSDDNGKLKIVSVQEQ